MLWQDFCHDTKIAIHKKAIFFFGHSEFFQLNEKNAQVESQTQHEQFFTQFEVFSMYIFSNQYD